MLKIYFLTFYLSMFFLMEGQSVKMTYSFMDYQKSFTRISEAIDRKEDTLISEFKQKKLPWPAKYIYIRSFKYDSQLEVWVKYSKNEKFRHFKTYKVCALSGSLGPKRMAGDYQVPEGFYYINEFNPKSQYHLSLGLNYPNESDKMLADTYRPGGDIYIHGSCVTTGCIPITNQQIEELYILAAHAKEQGQDFIPVHIFPVRFDNSKSMDYLTKFLKDYPEYQALTDNMKSAFNFFDSNKQIPLVMVGKKGEYLIQSNSIRTKESGERGTTDLSIQEPTDDHKDPIRKIIPEDELAKIVDLLPEFMGGPEEYQKWLLKINKETASYLPTSITHSNIMLEYIIDKDGSLANAQVIRGGHEIVNKKIEEAFMNMPSWKPAIRLGMNVPVKMKQTIVLIK